MIFSDKDLVFESLDPVIRVQPGVEVSSHAAELPPLLNPLAPLTPMRHAAIFELFPRWEGPLEHGMLVDFLGVRTPFEYDCEGTTPDEMRREREEGR